MSRKGEQTVYFEVKGDETHVVLVIEEGRRPDPHFLTPGDADTLAHDLTEMAKKVREKVEGA